MNGRLLEMLESFWQDQSDRGLPCFRSSHVGGEIIARQDVINRDMLSMVAGGRLSVRFQEGQSVDVLAVGFKTLAARIVRVDADLNVLLKIPWWAGALGAIYFAFAPAAVVRIAWTEATISVGSIPEVAQWRHIWKDRLTVALEAHQGYLAIRFDFTN